MDKQRTNKTTKKKKYPTGVIVRRYSSGKEWITIEFPYNGKRTKEPLGLVNTPDNITYAEQTRAAIIREIKMGIFDYARYFPDSKRAKASEFKRTIGELVEERLDYLEAQNKREKSTLDDRRLKFENHIEPNFGDLKPDELKPSHVTSWIRRSGLARSTVGMVLSIMRPILNAAVADGVIPNSPLDKIDFDDIFSDRAAVRAKQKEDDDDINPLNKQEIARVLGALDGQQERMFRFALFTGLRLQELPAVQWEDIDWKNRRLLVQYAIGQTKSHEYFKSTKTGERRWIDLIPPAYEALIEQRPYSQLRSKFIFFNKAKGKDAWIGLQAIYWQWRNVLKEVGIDYRSVKQTRHTFASMMLQDGEDKEWVRQQLGHKDLRMLERHYKRWIPEIQEGGYQTKNEWKIERFVSNPSRANDKD